MSSLTQTARVRSHFDLVSLDWGARYESPPRKMSDLDLQLRLDNCAKLLRPILHNSAVPRRIVDIGCGAGNLLQRIAHENVSAIGVDLAPQMLGVARARCPWASFVTADAGHLPLETSSADVVTCLGVLEYLSDPEAALGQIRRVLTADGHLIVSLPNRASFLRKLTRVEIAVEQAGIALINGVRGKHARQESPPYAHREWTFAEAEAMLADGSFRIQGVALQTYGTWGRLGTWPMFLGLSRKLSHRFRERTPFSQALAYTMLIHARAA